MTEGEGHTDAGATVEAAPESISRRAFRPNVLVRLQYAMYLFFALLLCLLKGSLAKALSHFSAVSKGCTYLEKATNHVDVSVGSDSCFENTVVYRVSFGLAAFFLIMFFSVSDLTCCIDAEARDEFQRRFFGWKTVLLSLITFVTFWIPNTFFSAYAWLCMFASAVFLVMQIVIFIDFSYQWNEDWGQRSENNGKWSVYLLIVSILCYVAALVVIVFAYIYFVPHEDCNTNATAVTLTLLAGLTYTCVAIWVPHGSILPSGIVFLYTSILCFSALRSSTNAYCNKLYEPEGKESILMIIVSAAFLASTLAYSAVATGGSGSSLSLQADADEADNPDESGHLSHYCYFHFVMILASFYLSMIATNWQISGTSSDGKPEGAEVAMWVKVASECLTICLYFWSLLAPYYCCKDRDFGYGEWE